VSHLLAKSERILQLHITLQVVKYRGFLKINRFPEKLQIKYTFANLLININVIGVLSIVILLYVKVQYILLLVHSIFFLCAP
jgi:hypothetical protein